MHFLPPSTLPPGRDSTQAVKCAFPLDRSKMDNPTLRVRITGSLGMLSATCHCGAVTIEIPRPPETVTNRNCSICRRYGTLWAYYPADDVRVTAGPGALDGY